MKTAIRWSMGLLAWIVAEAAVVAKAPDVTGMEAVRKGQQDHGSKEADDAFVKGLVIVRGAVRSPGSVSWTKDMTLIAVIGTVGGLNGWRAPQTVTITRKGERLSFPLRLIFKHKEPDPPVFPGDIIDIPE